MDNIILSVGVLPENTREVVVFLGTDYLPADHDMLAFAETILRGWSVGAGKTIPFHVTLHTSPLQLVSPDVVDINFETVESLDALEGRVQGEVLAGRQVFVRLGSDEHPITQEEYQVVISKIGSVTQDKVFVCGHPFRFQCYAPPTE